MLKRSKLVTPMPINRNMAQWPYALVALLVLHNGFMIAYGIQRHWTFETAGFDLGIWDQVVWNNLQGRFFWFTSYPGFTSVLGDHTELISLLIFPLYGLYPHPITLVILQSVVVSLGAIPIYAWAVERLQVAWAGVIFAAVYLLYPALQAAITFDFHGTTLAAPMLSVALWAMYKQYDRVFAVSAILAMTCKEDIPLLVLMMGVYMLVIQRRWGVGSVTVLGSLGWFVVAVMILLPAFQPAGGSIHLDRYALWGDGIREIGFNIITNPVKVLQVVTEGDKLLYWARITLPTAGLALLDPVTLMLSAPLLFINTLGAHPPMYQLDKFHYSAPLAAYVSFASINGVAFLSRILQPRLRYIKIPAIQTMLVGAIFLVTLLYQVQFGYTPIGNNFAWPQPIERHNDMYALMEQIPPRVPAAVENNLAPHLTHRQWLFVLPNFQYADIQAEYIMLDMDGNLYRHETIPNFCAFLDTVLANPDYGLIEARDGLLLFRRGAEDAATYEPRAPCLTVPHAP